MNISFSLSPATSAELDSMLDVLKRHGFTAQACPVSIVKPTLSQADTWEGKWRAANEGARVPVFAKRMREKYSTKEEFFAALMSGDETEGEGAEETEDRSPAPVVPVTDLDDDDI